MCVLPQLNNSVTPSYSVPRLFLSANGPDQVGQYIGLIERVIIDEWFDYSPEPAELRPVTIRRSTPLFKSVKSSAKGFSTELLIVLSPVASNPPFRSQSLLSVGSCRSRLLLSVGQRKMSSWLK